MSDSKNNTESEAINSTAVDNVEEDDDRGSGVTEDDLAAMQILSLCMTGDVGAVQALFDGKYHSLHSLSPCLNVPSSVSFFPRCPYTSLLSCCSSLVISHISLRSLLIAGVRYPTDYPWTGTPLSFAAHAENYRLVTCLCINGADPLTELEDEDRLDMRLTVATGLKSIESSELEYMKKLIMGTFDVKSLEIMGRFAAGLITDDELRFKLSDLQNDVETELAAAAENAHANEQEEADEIKRMETKNEGSKGGGLFGYDDDDDEVDIDLSLLDFSDEPAPLRIKPSSSKPASASASASASTSTSTSGSGSASTPASASTTSSSADTTSDTMNTMNTMDTISGRDAK